MNLKDYRKLRNITQQDLAAALGVTQGVVSQWERGDSEPSGRKAKEIVSLTDGLVTLDDLYPKAQAA